MTRVSIEINGRLFEGEVEPRTSLADYVRESCRLTGTHLGCEHGVCGACTLLVDEKPVRSCITLAVATDGQKVRTTEGFQDDELMGVIRRQFNLCHALQCGFCTPGMLAVAYDMVSQVTDLTKERIKLELSGNLCRCTGYAGIVDAIQNAAREWHGEKAAA